MPNKIDLIGVRFGKLIVYSESINRNSAGGVVWLCKCDCGNTKEIASASLRSGATTSCGCYGNEMLAKYRTRHGQCPRSGRIPEYQIWDAMIQRCTNPNQSQYQDYGGRGIKVCERWLQFENFFSDMGLRPSGEHSIDRFPDNDGNYEPSNCRWGTQEQQSRNRRSNVWIEHVGRRMILEDWAKELQTYSSQIRKSMKRGKTFEEIYRFYKNKNK